MLSQVAKTTPRVNITRQMGLHLYTPWLQQFDKLRKMDGQNAAGISTQSMPPIEEPRPEASPMENESLKNSPPRLTVSHGRDLPLRLYTPWLQQFDKLRKLHAHSATASNTQSAPLTDEKVPLKDTPPRLTVGHGRDLPLRLYTPWLQQFDALRKMQVKV